MSLASSFAARRKQHGGALPKVLLLIFFLCAAVGYWVWKENYGVIGGPKPLNFNSKDHVAFLRRSADGKTDLYIVKVDGTGERQMTQDAALKQGITWSPDGKQLCYAAEMKDGGATDYQLMILGGEGAKQLTRGSGSKSYPEWRPDGKQIAFLVGGFLKVVGQNGDDMQQVYPHMHKGGSEDEEDEGGRRKPPVAFYDWAPDGNTLAAVLISEGEHAAVMGDAKWFKNQGKPAVPDAAQVKSVADPETLLILPADGEEPVIRTETNSLKVGFSWFPDGNRVAVTMATRNNEHALVVLRADDHRLQPVALMVSGNQTISAENPAVSPDGSQVAFEAWRVDSAENRVLLGIAILAAEGSTPLILRKASDAAKLAVPIKGKAQNPMWSWDGKRVVYQVMRSTGERDLWASAVDGSGSVNLTKEKGDNFDAVSSPAK